MKKHKYYSGGQEDLNEVHIKEVLFKYFYYWPWFVLSLFICLSTSYIYLQCAIPKYNVSSILLVKDENKGGIASSLSAFADMGLMSGMKNNVDNEIEIIQSRTTIRRAIKSLDLNITYFYPGRIISRELYKESPIKCIFYPCTANFEKAEKIFELRFMTANTFEISEDGKFLGVFKYGALIALRDSKFRVVKSLIKPAIGIDRYKALIIKLTPLKTVVNQYKEDLHVNALSKTSSIVNLSLKTTVKEKGEDFLNSLGKNYNQDAITYKNYVLDNTMNFVESRIKTIATELNNVEKANESFKKQNKITDVVSDATLFMQTAGQYEKAMIEVESKLNVVSDMIDFMKNKGNTDLIPINILPADNGSQIPNFIAQYNDLVMQKNRIIKEGTPKNAIVINLNQKIDDLNQNIKEGVLVMKKSLKIQKDDLDMQNNLVSLKINKIPTQEREFRNIDRQQKIKETIYLYLLQKREETAISLSVTEPNAKVVDEAISEDNPISPKQQIIYLLAILLGMGIPFVIIYIKNLLDTKIKTREDIEKIKGIPFIGTVPLVENNEVLVKNSRSSIAESLRIATSNIEFMVSGVQEGIAKTIFVTSTLPEEGKTYIAINLATSFAEINKKVVLVGLDIRAPKIKSYFNIDESINGLTTYLSKKDQNIHDYIRPSGIENLDLLPSGIIPPNPVQLLKNGGIDALFDELKKEYDYIVVDTAPVSLVVDTIMIAKNADAFVYVIRSNLSEKHTLKLIKSYYKEKKLPNMALLLNGVKLKKSYDYGYVYGYGYGEGSDTETKVWYKQFLEKIKDSFKF
jgi:tyrosine-protein kinase Etk/Wzc